MYHNIDLSKPGDYGHKFFRPDGYGGVYVHDKGGPKSSDPARSVCVILSKYDLDAINKARTLPEVPAARADDV